MNALIFSIIIILSVVLVFSLLLTVLLFLFFYNVAKKHEFADLKKDVELKKPNL